MISHKELEGYLLSLPDTWLDYPFGEEVAVYKVGPKGDAHSTGSGQAKMFALIQEGSDPIRLSLKCDPQLAVALREKYESVMPGYHLNKKHWNTILLTSQLPWEEIQGFIRHSHHL